METLKELVFTGYKQSVYVQLRTHLVISNRHIAIFDILYDNMIYGCNSIKLSMESIRSETTL